MSVVDRVAARRVWDSRGNPTVEAEVRLVGGAVGRAIAPAGASRGRREAMDLRDGGSRLRGLDVSRALAAVRERIEPALLGRDVLDQRAIDSALRTLDPDPRTARVGGNAMVAVSMAAAAAAAAWAGRPLWAQLSAAFGTAPSIPLPEIQIFGGGAHAGRRTDVQDFLVMVPGAGSLDEALEVTAEIYHAAGAIMARRGRLAGVADEGGWWPDFGSNEEALETLAEAIVAAGETPGARVVIALDVAASELFDGHRYRLAMERRALDSDELGALLGNWIERYRIVSIEDPMAEDDPVGLEAFGRAHRADIQVVGDDCLVTRAALVDELDRRGACNAALIKPNQVGTVSEAVACVMAAGARGWRSIVSARSGESEDPFVAHLAVGLGCGQLKVGSFARSERMAKWNECLRIAECGEAGVFVGGAPLAETWWGRARAG